MTRLVVTMFSVRVPDDLARRFDAGASAAGGRSAKLRQLIATAALSDGNADQRELRNGARLMVRLSAVDAAAVDVEAARMGLRRATWVAALVRRRVRNQPTVSGADATAILAIQADLRRIGVGFNQMVQALNATASEGQAAEVDVAYLARLRAEIRSHLRGLRDALAGNLAYWDITP